MSNPNSQMRSLWRNSEDQALKAFVMKYGTNNWSRISSALKFKTPKQCKARWEEYLDPTINQSAWTRDEDEKLVRYIRVFPHQWKTIAECVGRTPTQCISRYEELLDVAAGTEPSSGTAAKANTRALQPHTIAPIQDAVDMEQEDQEMLAETRARLANVQTKKGKRRAREAMIEESKNAAEMQKARELRQAGVTLPGMAGRKTTCVDFTRDVVVSVEGELADAMKKEELRAQQLREEALSKRGHVLDVRTLEGKSSQEVQEQRRLKDKEKLEKRKREDLEGYYANVNEAIGGGTATLAGQLNLPKPTQQQGGTRDEHRLTMTARLKAFQDVEARPNALKQGLTDGEADAPSQPSLGSLLPPPKSTASTPTATSASSLLAGLPQPAPTATALSPALPVGLDLPKPKQMSAPATPAPQRVSNVPAAYYHYPASLRTPDDFITFELKNNRSDSPIDKGDGLAAARALVEAEVAASCSGSTVPQPSLDDFLSSRVGPVLAGVTLEDVTAALDKLRRHNDSLATRARLYMQGYEKKAAELDAKIVSTAEEASKAKLQLDVFSRVHEMERVAAQGRADTERRYLDGAIAAEGILQDKFSAARQVKRVRVKKV